MTAAQQPVPRPDPFPVCLCGHPAHASLDLEGRICPRGGCGCTTYRPDVRSKP